MAEERRSYTDDFKQAAVNRVEAGETQSAVAKDVGITTNSLKAWMNKFGNNEQYTVGNEDHDDLEEEVQRLRRDLALLQAENDYLKKREQILRR